MSAPRPAFVLAALMLGALPARGANPPNVMDVPPANVMPAPVDMSPKAPGVPVAPGVPADAQPVPRPSEPSGNPLWAIPLSALTATRDRPIFTPSRRPPAPPAVAAAPATAPPPPPAAPAEPEQPPLTLVGAIASGTEGFAVFLDQTTNNVIRLKTGQDHGGWVLRAVKGREATLEKNRRSTTLVLPPPNAAFGAPGAPPIPGTPQIPGRPRLPGGKQKEPEL